MKTRVLVVDDSALARDMVCAALARADDIEVVGMAADPVLARRQIALLHPDVITLDVEMPRMDGLCFLDQIMRLRPMPVVMVSSLTNQGSLVSLKALALGAVDVVAKPLSAGAAFDKLSDELVAKVRLAGDAKIFASQRLSRPAPMALVAEGALAAVVGAEGSVQAITDVLHSWPVDGPPLAVLPSVGSFDPQDMAEVLSDHTRATVVAAKAGNPLLPGQVTVFAPQQALTVGRTPDGTYGAVSFVQTIGQQVGAVDGPIDMLVHGLAHASGGKAALAVLTSAAYDGVKGVRAFVEQGGRVLVQDRASSMFHALADRVIRQEGSAAVPASHPPTALTGPGHQIVMLSRMAREILSTCQGG